MTQVTDSFQRFGSCRRTRDRDGKRNAPVIQGKKDLNVEPSLTARKTEEVNNPTLQAAKRFGTAHLKCRCSAAHKTEKHKQLQVKYELSYLACQIENLLMVKSLDSCKTHSLCPFSSFLLPSP